MTGNHSKWFHIFKYVFVGLCLLFFMLPIFWTISTSFKTPDEMLQDPPVWISGSPSLRYYVNVLSGLGGKALMNSFIIAFSNTFLALILGIPAAYGMARFNVGGKNLAFWFLSQRMLPPIALIIPIFLMFRKMHWIDTYQSLILVYLVFNLPYVIWMMRSFFAEIPRDLEESARVDGCSTLGSLMKVALPLVRNGIIATATFCFIFCWTEFILALILSRVKVVTLPVFMTGQFGSQFTLWGEISALSTIAGVPMFLIALILNRYLVRGLTMGAVK